LCCRHRWSSYYRVRAYNGSDSPYSNTASATTQAETSLPVGIAYDVVTDGDYAYVASDLYGGVVVVEVTAPTHPRGVGAVGVGFSPERLDRAGSLLVVTGVGNAIAVVDVANPFEPMLVGSLGVRASEVAVQGSYAYLVDAKGFAPYHLRVVDLSHPGAPVLAAEITVPGVPLDIAVVGDYAYIASNSVLLVVDVSLPSAPAVVSSLAVACRSIAASSGYAYIDKPDSYGALQVVDISNPTAPRIVRQNQVGLQFNRLVVQGSKVYSVWRDNQCVNKGFLLMDVANPAAPFTTGGLYMTSGAFSVAAYAPHAYVADTDGLTVIDVSDPYEPVIVGNAQ